jgi:putative copper export protein
LSQSILAISYFFHLVATVIWIGGLVVMVILVWPEMQRALAGNPALFALLAGMRRRFFPLTNLSLAVLIVTGLIQMTGDTNYEGVLQFTNEWSQIILLKHIAIGGMFICGTAMQFWIVPALERAGLLVERGKGDPGEWEKLRRREVRLTWMNVILGVLVLGFTAWATAI